MTYVTLGVTLPDVLFTPGIQAGGCGPLACNATAKFDVDSADQLENIVNDRGTCQARA
jgi:hypothetical protein